jgi:phosphate transport system substrate-binding protein
VNYQGLGSGAGINQFTQGTVDFAASDKAMSDEEMAKVSRGVQLIPVTAGCVVLVVNIPEVTTLKLSRQAYAGIFLGTINKWNDPVIQKCNEGTKLPALDIVVVHRSEASGTTAVFTKHLCAISENWKKGPGEGQSVKWPVGTGAKGNDGVAALVRQTPGAIGYIEYNFAMRTKQPMALLENKKGQFVAPSSEAGTAALAGLELPDNLRGWVPDPEGDQVYPIVTYSWLLLYKNIGNDAKAATIKSLVKYCLMDGQKDAESLGYIPLPKKIAERAQAALDHVK